MSWSVTLNDLEDMTELPEETLRKISEDNPAYRDDALVAFKTVNEMGLVSATLSGGRTPSPYGGPDTVVLSIIGFSDHRVGHAVEKNFNETMRQTIYWGPDDE